MALDIQIPYKGSDYLFQGISGGANNLASGAEAAIKRFKQIQDGGKAADYFMKAGGDQAYEELGVHPEEWKTLGPRDKMQAVQGLMQARSSKAQMEQMHGLAQEREAKAAELQMRTEEAQAWPSFMKELMSTGATSGTGTSNPAEMMSPGASEGGMGPAQGAPTMNLSRENIIAAMSKMGATNPRLASALSRQLIPQMMGQGTEEQPRNWMSANGVPYVNYHHTLIPDKPQMDMEAVKEMMGDASDDFDFLPNGRGGVTPHRKPQPPEAFFTRLNDIGSQLDKKRALLNEAPSPGATPAAIKMDKDFLSNQIANLESQAGAHIDLHAAQFKLPAARVGQMYKSVGMNAPGAKADATKVQTASGEAGGEPVVIKDKAGYDKLPKGTKFLKDGKLYTKP